MGIFDRLFPRAPVPGGSNATAVQAYDVLDLAGDLGVLDFLRNGNSSGASVNRRTILKNASVARCVFLISNAMGMLPFPLMKLEDDGKRKKAKDHPLYELLTIKPNGWQTAFEYRRLMQHRALTDGNGYSLIIRSRGAPRALIPIAAADMKVEQRDDWSLRYQIRNKAGGYRDVPQADILHIRGPSEDGIKGLALTDYASEVLGLSIRAQEAAARIFAKGVMAGGAFETDKKLSAEAIANLKASAAERYSGAENAGSSMVLQEGLKYKPIASTAKDSQMLETRAHQIEEIARIFGVPRPFLMVDDTSWGSGIEQLGIYFVQYGLAPWFKAWEDAVSITLLTDQERRAGYYPKFNERALLRGSMKDQGEFFAKMMGSGGSPQIMEQNEARALLDLPDHVDGSGLSAGTMGATNVPPENS
jgi:HK97 family phage portal protein